MDDQPRSFRVEGTLDEGTLFLESQPMWRNTLVRFIIPFEMVTSSLILLTIAYSTPQSRATLLWVWAIVCIALPLLVMMIRLKVSLSRETLRVTLPPFAYYRIPIEQIVRVEHISVDPMRAFGGWGLKFTKKYGTVLNISGKDHIVVELENGKKRTIGTQDPEWFIEALRAVCDLEGPNRAADQD